MWALVNCLSMKWLIQADFTVLTVFPQRRSCTISQVKQRTLKCATYFLLAEKGTISPDALRLRITLGVTSESITWWRSGDNSSLVCDVTVTSTWSNDVYDIIEGLVAEVTVVMAHVPSFLHLEKLLLRLLTKPEQQKVWMKNR